MQVLGNCNYAVELGKKLNFVLVGIAGGWHFVLGGTFSWVGGLTLFLARLHSFLTSHGFLDKPNKVDI